MTEQQKQDLAMKLYDLSCPYMDDYEQMRACKAAVLLIAEILGVEAWDPFQKEVV